jgi:hypothetical protein
MSPKYSTGADPLAGGTIDVDVTTHAVEQYQDRAPRGHPRIRTAIRQAVRDDIIVAHDHFQPDTGAVLVVGHRHGSVPPWTMLFPVGGESGAIATAYRHRSVNREKTALRAYLAALGDRSAAREE